jgi:hypothetical protein
MCHDCCDEFIFTLYRADIFSQLKTKLDQKGRNEKKYIRKYVKLYHDVMDGRLQCSAADLEAHRYSKNIIRAYECDALDVNALCRQTGKKRKFSNVYHVSELMALTDTVEARERMLHGPSASAHRLQTRDDDSDDDDRQPIEPRECEDEGDDEEDGQMYKPSELSESDSDDDNRDHNDKTERDEDYNF